MRTRTLLIMVVTSVCLPAYHSKAFAGQLQVLDSIPMPSPGAGHLDIAWDGQHLWAMLVEFGGQHDPNVSATVYQIRPSDGSVVTSFDLLLSDHQGLTWNGTQLWSTNNAATLGTSPYGSPPDTLPDSIDKFGTDGEHLGTFSPPHGPDAITTGITWDGAYLWLSDSKHREIAQVDPSDGSVITSFASPGTQPDSLAWDGTSLWSVDIAENVLHQLDTLGNLIETWTVPGVSPAGVTFDGEHLWVLDDQNDLAVQVVVAEPSNLVGILVLVSAALCVICRERVRPRRQKVNIGE